MANIRKQFGENVRRLRISLNISQEKLAETCGLHRTYIGGIERGERNVSLDNVQKLAAGLGVKPKELFREV